MQTHRNELFKRALRGEILTDFPIIDHHGHFNLFPRGMSLQEEITDIITVMDNCGISRGVVFHCSLEEDYPALNDIILKGISFYPARFIGYAFINMTRGTDNALREIGRCRKLGMKGLKLHCGGDIEPFTSTKFIPVWKKCAELGWPVIIHGMDYHLAYDYPETIFIGAHNIESINQEAVLKAMLDCPNYYWDTSATICQMGAIEKAVALFGADKLIFGSDYNGNNMAARLGSVLTAKIPAGDMKKILGGNIIRLLNLEPRSNPPM